MELHSDPDVFLSSAFGGFMDVRDDIHALAPERIWAVEKKRPDLDTSKGTPPFVIVDTLVEQIRKSKVFICVLRDRYGSSVFESAESVSFLETEIYEAALYHANVHFFLMEPFSPDPRLIGLLEIMRAIRPGIIPYKILSQEDVLDNIRKVLNDTKQTRQRKWSISLRELVAQLAATRGHPKPDIEFFDKVFRPVSRRPDKDHLDILLTDIGKEPSIEKRLTRMWIALRELSAAPYDDDSYSEYMPFWDKALSSWASAAAWYGLHGHLYAGRLAGVNSMLRIRERMDWSHAEFDPIHYIHGTKGGRASEYYSMAKLMAAKRERDLYFNLALSDVEEALRSITGDPSGLLAIRGHIFFRQGKIQNALRDFENVRKLREEKNDPGGIGEALADLGLVHLRRGNLRAARKLLMDGVELLDDAGSFTFAIRARKRLAFSHLTTGHPIRALRELCVAYDSAQEHQVYGQITPLMETMHDLACRLGIWHSKLP